MNFTYSLQYLTSTSTWSSPSRRKSPGSPTTTRRLSTASCSGAARHGAAVRPDLDATPTARPIPCKPRNRTFPNRADGARRHSRECRSARNTPGPPVPRAFGMPQHSSPIADRCLRFRSLSGHVRFSGPDMTPRPGTQLRKTRMRPLSVTARQNKSASP